MNNAVGLIKPRNVAGLGQVSRLQLPQERTWHVGEFQWIPLLDEHHLDSMHWLWHLHTTSSIMTSNSLSFGILLFCYK